MVVSYGIRAACVGFAQRYVGTVIWTPMVCNSVANYLHGYIPHLLAQFVQVMVGPYWGAIHSIGEISWYIWFVTFVNATQLWRSQAGACYEGSLIKRGTFDFFSKRAICLKQRGLTNYKKIMSISILYIILLETSWAAEGAHKWLPVGSIESYIGLLSLL